MNDRQAPPPPAQVLQMLMGLWVSQILGACARFGVADVIASGEGSADVVADRCGADRVAMYRLLRGGAAVGLFAELPGRQFALTPLGECLRANVPGSLRDLIVAETAPGHWLPWGRLYDTVQGGSSVATETLGQNVWEYYATHADEAAWFARGMGNLSAMVSHDVARLYDAGGFKRIVDVGGSQGVLLAALLRQSESSRGVVFDRPEVIEEARATVEASELASRIELVGGDFFKEAPAGGDLYVLKSILHDWPDEECLGILRTIRAAAAPNAKLLVVEMLVPEEPQPSPVALMDLNMLVMLNGKERTIGELDALFEETGFARTQVLQTGGLFSIIEARAQ